MGKDFIITWLAIRYIMGLFIGGGISIFVGIFAPFDHRITPLFLILGLVLSLSEYPAACCGWDGKVYVV